jgi:hypothetical protein
MMNAGKFLVLAVHEIAIAAEFAIAAVAAEKPDTNSLTDCPTLDTQTKCIDAPDNLVARDTRISNTGENSIDCCGIRMADAARLNTNAYLIGTGVVKWFSYFRELSRSRDLYGSVSCVHIASDFV